LAARLSADTAIRTSRWLALGGFVVLALYLRVVPEPVLDRGVLDWLWEPPISQSPLAEAITTLGDSRLLVALALMLGAVLYWRGARRLAALPLFGVASGALLSYGIKLVVARPTTWFPLWGRLTSTDDSFPSGHAVQTIVFYGLLATLALEWPPLARQRRLVVGATIALVALIGYTRVYLGNHWPTDVVGGWLLGWGWLGVLGALRRKC
jgi:membrane-associated phospholipid phosphatase